MLADKSAIDKSGPTAGRHGLLPTREQLHENSMSALAEELNVSHLRGWVGREEVHRTRIDAEHVARFRSCLNLEGGLPQHGDTVPHLFHFCLGQPFALTAELGSDGHPQKGGFLPPVPLPRRMWAGGSLRFFRELRVGDAVRRVSRIADVALKEGSCGPLCFVTVIHSLEVDGVRAIDEQQNIVYRGEMPARRHDGPIPFEVGKHQKTIEPTPTLLFRYSAVTFNGHRIHYDRAYAIDVEGYPGLVVNGPLQATLLLTFATELYGRSPSWFEFRNLSPLFDGSPIVLHANRDNARMKLWTASELGPVATVADAEWS